jgi:hypothetical protein
MKSPKPPKTPLASLLSERMAVLGLNATAIGRRLGYANPAKAAGRVQALGDGFLDNADSRRALTKLAAALEVDEERVATAVEETRGRKRAAAEAEAAARRARWEAEETAWRRDFQPHAVLVTEFTRPWSIVMCMMTGGAAGSLLIKLDLTQPPETYITQALTRLESRLTRRQGGEWRTAFFGRVVGVAINLTPEDSLHYDVTGRLLGHQARAVRLGGGSVAVVGGAPRPPISLSGPEDSEK